MIIRRKMLAVAALSVMTGFTLEAHALPIFTFTQYAGFAENVRMARYTDHVTADASLIPGAGPLYSTMSWVGNRARRSSLELDTVVTPAELMADSWTTISTLLHHNEPIRGSRSWSGQDIWGRLIVSDAEGGSSEVLDSVSVITLDMTETGNDKSCSSPNPFGSFCDDYFTLTAPLDDLFFSANDGSQWMASFRYGNVMNPGQMANVFYTGEGMTSSVDLQVLLTSLGGALVRADAIAVAAIPEPATVLILALSLAGLGFTRHHTSNKSGLILARQTR